VQPYSLIHDLKNFVNRFLQIFDFFDGMDAVDLIQEFSGFMSHNVPAVYDVLARP
jgi:hypothetical protein